MTELALVKAWDAALTYGSIAEQHKPDEGPFFVGREALLGALEQAIREPELRGTYLISGYRGAGKTSLVIEAARRANQSLGENVRLLTLVLNVSEVSASLDAPANGEAGRLCIDARRVITALLRTLDNQSFMDRKLETAIHEAYLKATATEYKEVVQRKAERSATRKAEQARSIEIANVLKLVAALAGLAGIVLGVAWLAENAAFPVAIVALAAVAVFSFRQATTKTELASESDLSDAQRSNDNSLQQIETDLRDILAALHANKIRTIFVLEELDKLSESENDQLKDVIRYFKNLFTQAPALFFFLTDKAYFDSIDAKIAKARLEGSYAVEHTFFTQRIFVTRPSLEECLEYFGNVFDGSGAPTEAIAAIRERQADRVRPIRDMSAEERFLRGVLYRSQNHLFDLKAVVRGYVQIRGGRSVLVFDDGGLTPDDDTVAAFQFLIEQKARLYRFDGGRDYANEVLRDCLSRVFADLGGEQEHNVAELYPPVYGSGAQVSRAERNRIVAAVDSLLAELDRGGAIDLHPLTPSSPPTFRWRTQTLAKFTPSAELEPNERAFQEKLKDAVAICGQFAFGGPLAGQADVDAGAAEALVTRFSGEIEALDLMGQPMAAEEIRRRETAIDRELEPLLTAARDAHQQALRALDWALATGGQRNVFVSDGEADADAIVLVYGTAEADRQRVIEDLTPAAVVVVDDHPQRGAAATEDIVTAWRTGLAHRDDPPLVVVLPLAAGAAAASEELALASHWCAGMRGDALPDGATWLWEPDAPEQQYPSTAAAVTRWLNSDSRVLAAPEWTPPELARIIAVAGAATETPCAVYDPGLATPSVSDLLDAGRLIPLDVAGARRSIATEPPEGRLLPTTTMRAHDDADTRRALAGIIGPRDPRWTPLVSGAAEQDDVDAMIGLLVHDPVNHRRWVEVLVETENWDAVMRAATEVRDQSVKIALLTASAEADHVPAMLELATLRGAPEINATWGQRLVQARAWPELLAASDGVDDDTLANTWLAAVADADLPVALSRALVHMPAHEHAGAWEQALIATRDPALLRATADAIADVPRRQRVLEAAAEEGDLAAIRMLADGEAFEPGVRSRWAASLRAVERARDQKTS